MKLQRLIKHALAIQSVPAPTFREQDRGALIQRLWTASGLREIDVDKAGNVLARVAGTTDAPAVVVSAHLDSVFEPDQVTPARRVGNLLIGPGIGDNAVALAVLAELAEDLPARRPRSDVFLAANVCEEGLGNLLGMQHIVERFGEQVAGYIVLEGMALGHIYHRGLPIRRFRIEARGEGGHSWIHAGRPSAIHTLIDIGRAILDLDLPDSPRSSFNIGRIVGGTSINSIASSAAMEIDLRSEDPQILDQWVGILEDQVESMASEELEIQFDAIGHRPGGAIPANHPLVQAAVTSHRDVLGSEPVLECGSTDASLPLSVGLPSVCVGITHGGEAHSLQEFISIEPIQAGYEALVRLVMATAVGPPAEA
jgi:tripeptide aminopeptidase